MLPQPPLRIVIVNDVFHPADETAAAVLDRFTTLTGWADAIQAHGAEVLVCQRFRQSAEITRGNIRYRFIADGHAPRPAFRFAGSDAMVAAVSAFEPSVVHVNGLDYPRAIRRLARALRGTIPIAVQDHGGFDPGRIAVLRRAALRWGLGGARMLLVATPPQTVEFRRSGLVPASVSIRDVMESSTRFVPRRNQPPSRRLNILWVGRLNANKDPLTVLEGFARFAEIRSDATLTYVYGTSELEPALRRAIGERAGLSNRVKLVGSVPHETLESIYSEADIFVLGSRREGSGYAAIEAMACGAVPVLTDIPSFRGLTDEGRVGMLWHPGDPQSLASALTQVSSAETLAALPDACRTRFVEHFSWNAIGARAVALYAECCGRRSRAAPAGLK